MMDLDAFSEARQRSLEAQPEEFRSGAGVGENEDGLLATDERG